MTVSYFVRYEVSVAERDSFLDYYRRHHVPILARWPGIRRIVLHTPVDWQDAHPVRRGRTLLLSQLEFDSLEALQAALRSPERAAARTDMANFPSFDGEVTHQALATVEAWRRS